MSYDLDSTPPTVEQKPVSQVPRIRGIYRKLIDRADAAKERREAFILEESSKVEGRTICTCGSGRKYKNCCRTKGHS
jgi:uncharacterized protein YecA (UPF0149 family)